MLQHRVIFFITLPKPCHFVKIIFLFSFYFSFFFYTIDAKYYFFCIVNNLEVFCVICVFQSILFILTVDLVNCHEYNIFLRKFGDNFTTFLQYPYFKVGWRFSCENIVIFFQL